jgi:hypothetical protein
MGIDEKWYKWIFNHSIKQESEDIKNKEGEWIDICFPQ